MFAAALGALAEQSRDLAERMQRSRGGAARDRDRRRRRRRGRRARRRALRRRCCARTRRARPRSPPAPRSRPRTSSAPTSSSLPDDPRLAAGVSRRRRRAVLREPGARRGLLTRVLIERWRADAELVERCLAGRPRRLERARRELLALRLRDRLAGLPAPGRRRRGRVPGGLPPRLRPARHAAQPGGAPPLDRPADAARLPRPARGGRREEPAEVEPDGIDEHGRRARRGVRRPRGARRALGGVPGGARPLLLPRRELPDDRRGARDPSGTIASRISRCLGRLRERFE